ncbi:uncharacterized protein [Typha latifolia]|uniref:uncharacterized protein isoform X2 n=1 Tax=Typha latifolia TaxID=4733 RepID=UPI003C2F7959
MNVMSLEKILSNYVCNKLDLAILLWQLECISRGFRIAGLEQEIENLQKKLAGCLRDKHNLQEELAESYQIKSQLSDLHSAEILKNKEAEKQVKFFQSCVAAAFAERDHSLLECEKSKEREEAISKKFVNLQERIEELQSKYLDEKRLNDALQMELRELKILNESSLKVITKFYEARQRETGCSSDVTLEEKCSCLLDDSSDSWIFSTDQGTSTSKYIASLEEEKESLRNSVDKLQSNLRMGLEIENHLKRNVRSLEKKLIMFEDYFRNGLFVLQNFCCHQRHEIMKMLEKEESHMKAVITEVQDKLSQIHIRSELNIEGLREEQQNDDTECRDVHVNVDADSIDLHKNSLPTSISNGTFGMSEAFAQALQEKVATLLLLSQQEERQLLERDMNEALQKKIQELQRNLFQVTDEKVKALTELANLKQEYQLLQEKYGNYNAVEPVRSIGAHEQEGKLKSLFKKTYLNRWIRKDLSQYETDVQESSERNRPTIRTDGYSVDLARLKIENAALQESIANMEHLTSSVHRLHILLLKAHDDVKSAHSMESIYEALNSITTEASLVKAALGGVLPVSWSGDASDVITYESLYEPTDLSSKSDKVDALSAAGLEMVELLMLASGLLKESFIMKNAGPAI